MTLKYNDNQNFIIYLPKEKIGDMDFSLKEDLESYFKSLFKRLKGIYNIDCKGYYNIKVYVDDFYGVVLDIKKEEVDYYNYFENQVDMRINCINTNFLYEIDDLYDLPTIIIDKSKLFKCNRKLFIELKEPLGEGEIGKLMEFSRLIYNVDDLTNRLIEIDYSIK